MTTKTLELRIKLICARLGITEEDFRAHVRLVDVEEYDDGFDATWDTDATGERWQHRLQDIGLHHQLPAPAAAPPHRSICGLRNIVSTLRDALTR